MLIWLLIIITSISNPNRPQSCNPAVVDYLVRDENGKILTETDLKSVYERLPKTIDDAHVDLGEVSFADDQKTFYWPESVDWPKGNKKPSISFANAGTCTMHLTEATLVYRNKKMRLIFNIDIARDQRDRRPVVDSLPFQEGTFALDLNGWSRDPNQLTPSHRWKKITTP